MSPNLKKLNEHINQLVIWCRENEGLEPTKQQRERLENIAYVIVNSEKFRGEENSVFGIKLSSISAEELRRAREDFTKKTRSVKCEYCAGSIGSEGSNSSIDKKYIGSEVTLVDFIKLRFKNRISRMFGFFAITKLPELKEIPKAQAFPGIPNYSDIERAERSPTPVDASVSPNNIERQLDLSRDYWSIRENGKYGSFPDSDDYSEESFS